MIFITRFKKRILCPIYDRLFWFKFSFEVYMASLPISWWALREYTQTGDLGYLHDALRGLCPL